MWITNRFAIKERSFTSARGLVVALAFGAFSIGCVRAQTAPAKGSAEASSAPPPFSIETEMLTYRALQSNSEAVACDIAAYLNGANANFTNAPVGSVCDVKAGTKKARVVLLPFDSSEFADFQIWRADMATMARLQRKAEVDCPPESGSTSKGGTTTAKSAAGAAVGMSPAGPPLALAQSVLAMMASEESTSPVVGTVHDQAFMDGVGRELQELSVPVLMPTAYTPYSLASLDESTSPFLASLDRILAARGCLEGLAANDDAKTKRIQRTISDINAFLDTLTKGAVSPPKSTKEQAAKPAGGSPPAQNPDGTQSSAVTAAGPSSSHLSAVLLADGLAAKLGVDPDKGTLSPDDEASLHILLVKALESGGSVTRFGNILGTKIRYSGGSVGTYALFSMDGDLECSGNVYEYGGSLKAKDFQRELRKYNPDPARQMVFLRHSCRPQPQTR
jgi:hypothetical protein